MEVASTVAGYKGDDAAEAAQEDRIRLEVLNLPEAKRGFVLLSRRWAVEGSFGWAARFRHLAREDEGLPEKLAGLHFLAFALHMAANFVRLLVYSS